MKETFRIRIGNEMTMSLNNSAPRIGYFIHDSDALWSAIGGPAFTIIQGLIFLWITWMTKSIYAYSVAFFAVFSRFFSIVFGGINLQDQVKNNFKPHNHEPIYSSRIRTV